MAQGFAGFPRRGAVYDLKAGRAEVAILGVADASPYVAGERSHAAEGPGAIRTASDVFKLQLKQFDYDIGGTMLGSEAERERVVDLGDVPTDPGDAAGNRGRIEAAVRGVLAAGAVPVVLGGDDSVPIPVFAAFEGRGPFTIVQVDAHVDWGDVIRGNALGYGSPMRRASEMGWITGMVQVGMRGLGSGMAGQLEDARGWGSRIVTAREVRRDGVEAVVAKVPEGGDVLLSIDCDGLDPSVLPAVNMPTPGGLDYVEMAALLEGVGRRARICGCNLVELVPKRDVGGLSALVAARMVLTVIGMVLARAPRNAPGTAI